MKYLTESLIPQYSGTAISVVVKHIITTFQSVKQKNRLPKVIMTTPVALTKRELNTRSYTIV